MSLDLSQAPYWDDYDASKNYHRILFTPGRAVQAREFNQLQTLLQEQIQRFGNHVFQNGSMVIPGESNYNVNYEYVTVRDVQYQAISEILETNQVTITGKDSGVVAQIMQYQPNVGSDPITFYVQYLNGSEDGTISRFSPSESLELTTAAGINFADAVCVSTGVGSVFNINAGIFYINGFFVESDTQSIILSRYTSTPSVVIGFRLNETTVDWTEDQTLLDNSNGSTNINAIGADRLKLTLQLESHDYGTAFDRENFIELASFKDGVLQSIVKTTDYSVLEETLARRTYDESGDYTVEPFGLDVREHLNTGSNGGVYTPTQGGDSSKFVLGVEPGKAYVRGYEITNIATKYLEVAKARDVGTVDNSATSLSLGSFIEATAPNTTPLIGKVVRFYSGLASTPGSVPAGTVLGSAYVVSVEKTSTATIKLYLVRVRNAAEQPDSSFIVNAKTAYIAGSPAFTSVINPVLQGTSEAGLLFKLPVSNVKTLLDGTSVSDTSLTVVRQITATADSSGTVILTAGTNEVFVQPNSINSFASYGTTLREIATISTLGGTPNGKALTIALGAAASGASITITVEVAKQVATAKSKTLTTTNITTNTVINTNAYSLGKADVTKINSVIQTSSGLDVTSKFTLERNALADFYGISYVRLNSGEVMPTGSVTITFQYFAHGTSGDFFSADSYTVPYEDIPYETINGVKVKASDILDFRPRKPDNDSNDFVGAGFNSVEVPFPSTLLRADLQYYLPRIDKVYVDSKGNFGTVKGVPDNNPKEPKTPDNSMLLYRVNIPAYTSSLADVVIETINNRRYTMRDIGKLEDRISNLEYYVTLSLLETEAASMQITDTGTGLNRFKNGFVVDSFVNHSVGNFSSQDYKCSVSPEYSFLRPEFYADQVDMKFSTSKSGAKLTGSLVTLPYTEVNFLSQEFASTYLNVNPYAVYRWNGDMTLSPSNDTWFDTVYTNPKVTYQVFNNGNLTQTWNSWQLYWSGASVSSTLYNLGGTDKYSTDGYFADSSHGVVGSLTTTTTSTSVQVIEDKVIDNSVIPYMRSREVAFTAVGLKPSTKMFAFFDNVNVSAYCKQTGKAYGTDMVTDANGKLTGVFLIPNNNQVRFRTGTKQFTLIDNATNSKENSLAYGDADYTAKGTLVTRTQSILATQKVSQTVVPWDPLAQSFFVEKDGGVFLTSIEVYFASKDPSASITMEIRNMVNGYPGQDVVPYSKVTLSPSQVNVSANAGVATKFTFNSPVYLTNGNEYCYVIMSNSNNYNVYIATMGEKVIGSNAYISKQPYVGVLFKSQNNTTWSEDQNSDMKFKINVAKFVTNQNFAAAFVNDKTITVNLASNPLTSVANSSMINARVPNHNLFVGSKVTIAGVDVAPAGLTLAQLNKQQIVTNVIDADNFTFTLTSSATVSGTFGGASVSSERNMLINTIYPSFQELLIENTNVDWTMAGVTGKSLSGNETPFVATPAYSITPNNNSDLPFPLVIPSVSDSTVVAGDYMTITANMITYADNISPVIDVNRAGVIGIVNRINSPTVLSETAATGGNAIARYMTGIIGLTDPANALKMFLDINKPQGSGVSVFYKTGNSEEEVNAKTWSVLPTIVSVTASDVNTYNEAEYSKDGIADFGFFQFKIVLTSTSSSAIPSCKRMRGIALGT